MKLQVLLLKTDGVYFLLFSLHLQMISLADTRYLVWVCDMSHFVNLFDAMQLVTIECTQNVYILYYIKELVLYIILGAAVGVVGEHVV